MYIDERHGTKKMESFEKKKKTHKTKQSHGGKRIMVYIPMTYLYF